jgi:hypothetical protein
MRPPLFAWLKALRSLIAGTQKRKPYRNEARYRLQLEQLEDRVVPSVTLTNPGTLTNYDGDSVNVVLNVADTSSFGPLNYTASGLPSGLSIMPIVSSGPPGLPTGLITIGAAPAGMAISGTISSSADVSSPYSVSVTATDVATGDSDTESFTWYVTNPVSMTSPGS